MRPPPGRLRNGEERGVGQIQRRERKRWEGGGRGRDGMSEGEKIMLREEMEIELIN